MRELLCKQGKIMTDQIVAENVIGTGCELIERGDCLFEVKVALFLEYLILKYGTDFEDFTVGAGFEIQQQ